LRGFRYHTGLVFGAYLEGFGAAVATGGRYNNVGAVFGRNRAATGFAFDLKALATASSLDALADAWVSAPESADPELAQRVRQLRQAGRTVVTALGGTPDPRCREALVKKQGGWVCQPCSPGAAE